MSHVPDVADDVLLELALARASESTAVAGRYNALLVNGAITYSDRTRLQSQQGSEVWI